MLQSDRFIKKQLFSTKSKIYTIKGFKVLVSGSQAASFYVYEDIGLSGCSSHNEGVFVELTRMAEELLGNRKPQTANPCDPFYGIQHREITPWADMQQKPVARYLAMAMIQSRLNRKDAVGIPESSDPLIFSSIQHGMFRALTKGVMNSSKKVDAVLLQNYRAYYRNPYAPVIDALKEAAGRNFGRA